MKRIFLPLLLVMTFSAKAMDDKKPFPDPEIAFPDPDMLYQDSSTADSREMRTVDDDNASIAVDWERIRALCRESDKSSAVDIDFYLGLDDLPMQLVGQYVPDQNAHNSSAEYLSNPEPFGQLPKGILEASPTPTGKTLPDGNEEEEILIFDSRQRHISAFCWSEKGKKGQKVTVIKNLDTGSFEIGSHETVMRDGFSTVHFNIDPDRATVFKLKQKIAEFELNKKAKE